MDKLLDYLQSKIKGWNLRQFNSIFLYGCSNETVILAELLWKMGVEIKNVLDVSKRKENTCFCGIKVVSPSTIKQLDKDSYCVIVWSLYSDSMITTLNEYGCKYYYVIDVDRECELYLEGRQEYLFSALESFEGILSKYPDDLFLIAPKASGDIYLSLSFLEKWKLKNKINQEICIIGQGNNAGELGRLYGVLHYVKVSEFERRRLIFLTTFFDKELPIKLLSPWELTIRNSFFPIENREISFVDKYRYEVFDLESGTEGDFPQYVSYKEKQQYVILSPYAYSSPAPILTEDFWESLVEQLKVRGMDVFTLGYGEKEPPIRGTELIRFRYNEIGEVVGKSMGFIAVRSGICDIVHNISTNIIVLFSNERNPLSSSFYGMKQNYKDFMGDEIICDRLSKDELVDIILRKVDIL